MFALTPVSLNVATWFTEGVGYRYDSQSRRCAHSTLIARCSTSRQLNGGKLRAIPNTKQVLRRRGMCEVGNTGFGYLATAGLLYPNSKPQ